MTTKGKAMNYLKIIRSIPSIISRFESLQKQVLELGTSVRALKEQQESWFAPDKQWDQKFQALARSVGVCTKCYGAGGYPENPLMRYGIDESRFCSQCGKERETPKAKSDIPVA
jgi:hypothetical protein